MATLLLVGLREDYLDTSELLASDLPISYRACNLIAWSVFHNLGTNDAMECLIITVFKSDEICMTIYNRIA